MSLLDRLLHHLTRRRRYRIAAVGRGTLRKEARVKARVPVRIDGDGEVILEAGVTLGYAKAPRMGCGEILLQARDAGSVIRVGAGSTFSNNVSVIATRWVTLGRDCLIGDGVLIVDSDFHHLDPGKRRDPDPPSAPVEIGDNVWIGARAVILKGVTIGLGSVVAAGAVVTRSVPERTVVAGNPARSIKNI